jgi:hypothetical protein
MAFPTNIFSNFLALDVVLTQEDLFEVRIENNANGQAIYVGKTQIQDAGTNQPFWALTKLEYDINGFLERVRLPDGGQGFLYIWDNRASYFT